MIKYLMLLKIKNIEIQWGLASMIYKIFGKKISGSAIKYENMSNQEFVEELLKPVIRKFKKWKVYSPFIDHIWGANLANMQLISKFNKGVPFLLCVIDIFSKKAWVIPSLMLFKKLYG